MQPPESRLRSLIIGAVVIVVPSLLRQLAPGNPVIGMVVGCLACVALVGGGVVAVWHFTNATRATLRPGDGAMMGLQTGAVALVFSTALSLLFWLFAGMPNLSDFFAEQMQRGGQDVPPEQAEMMMQMFSNPGVLAAIIVVSVLATLAAPALGGLLGASIFKPGGELPPRQTY